MRLTWRRHVRQFRYRLAELDPRRVAPFRQVDAHGVALACGVIIFAKLVTQARGLDTHDGIDSGVEILRAIKHGQSDVVALQPLAAPGERFVDDVFKEPLPALRLQERRAVKDALQLLANGRLVGFAPEFERNYRHTRTSNRAGMAAVPSSSGMMMHRPA